MPTFEPYSDSDASHNSPMWAISQWQAENSDHSYYPHWYWRDIIHEIEDLNSAEKRPRCECCRPNVGTDITQTPHSLGVR